MNINSSNIKIFPAARRTGSYDPFSRLMSESTVTSIINKLVDSDGFVVNSIEDTFSISDNDAILGNWPRTANDTISTVTVSSDPAELDFNIFGYFIKLDSNGVFELLDSLSSENDIYAHIVLDSTHLPDNNGPEYVQLIGTDDEGVYTGVVFTNSDNYSHDSDEVHTLHLLTKKNFSGTDWWVIPRSSVIKFYSVDGGEI